MPLAPHSLITGKSTSQHLRRAINYALKPDSLGWYEAATTASTNQRQRQVAGYDGTYYEGAWQAGKREGFGFCIAPKKPLRVGEWKNDRYKGERLVYTSDRIYGIDISKYQHGKGKKKYPIDWSRLRITHLAASAARPYRAASTSPSATSTSRARRQVASQPIL